MHNHDSFNFEKNVSEALIWKGWEIINTHGTLNAIGTRMLGLFGSKMPRLGPLKEWTRVRTTPKFAKKSLHTLVKEQGVDDE